MGSGSDGIHEDVPEYARRHKLTLEEAGRDVRRQCLEKAADAWGGAKIALAHHQDDNVETLLLNLSRGCGLKGLGGIPPGRRPVHSSAFAVS